MHGFAMTFSVEWCVSYNTYITYIPPPSFCRHFDFSDKNNIFVSPIKLGYCTDKPKNYLYLTEMAMKRYVIPRLTMLHVGIVLGFSRSLDWYSDAKGDPSFEDVGSYDV